MNLLSHNRCRPQLSFVNIFPPSLLPILFSLTHTSPFFSLIAADRTSNNMALSDTDYEIISPFTLAVQTGNNNDVPESSLNAHITRPAFHFNDVPEGILSSRVHSPGFNFDDADSCVIVTSTPVAADDDNEYVDDFEHCGVGSPGWLPVIKFANPGGVAANTATTVQSGPHRSYGFDWSLLSPYEEEDAISSTHATVVSSPELAASIYTSDGRSSSTAATIRTADSLLSTASTLVERSEIDVSPLLPPRPFPDFTFSGGDNVASALRRPIAVGESAFTRGERTDRGSRAHEESQAAAAPLSEWQRNYLARLTASQRSARSSGDQIDADGTRIAWRLPAGHPASVRDLPPAYPPFTYRHGGGAPS
jgi:hypothetical protein